MATFYKPFLSPVIVLVIVACFALNVKSVDRSNFKTCEQSSFCRRSRAKGEVKSSYEIDADTLAVNGNSVSVELVNTDFNVRFLLTISGLVENTLRIKVVEKEPSRPRFYPWMVLKDEPSLGKLAVLSKSEQAITLDYNGYKIELITVPFRLNVYSGAELIVSSNAKGWFRFEHTRPKPENRDESEDPGAWEENWKSHHDTKPHGPNAVAMDFTFHGAEYAYGLPEHADSLALKTTTKGDPYRFYNLDVFEYELDNPMALYASIPLLIAHGGSGTRGVFWMNPSETWVDVVSDSTTVVSSIVNFVSGGQPVPQIESHFISECGNIEAFIFLGPSPHDVFKQYTLLTGTGALPPYFALGYHQSRWNYVDQEDVNAVHKGFDQHDIPVDVIWLDIEHTDGKKYFTWDPYKFSKPIEMQQNLTAKGRKLVVIVDPHIKRDPGYFLHNDATNNGYYVKNKENNDYDGWCWPGSSGYLDFLNPVVMDYYSSRYKLSNYVGSTEDLYLWNDMNEPSVFNGPEITMPKDNIHYGGWEHREVHNLYGLLQTMGTYNGMIHRKEGVSVENTKRPFILTRSAFAGSQRYTAIWTGDNSAEWSHLAASVPMCLSMALGGMSFCGADVGGFFKNPEKELFVRWYQAGAWLPFFRAHSHIDTRRREPWLFDDETVKLVRSAVRQRYSYIPLWYTLFHFYNTTGAPVIRPLWVEYPKEKGTFGIGDQLLIGNSILVKPVTEAGATKVTVYFPGELSIWYDVETYKPYKNGQATVEAGLSKVPVYQAGGTIIAKKERVRRATTLMHDDPYTLVVALDPKGYAEGYLYIDDGTTFRYNYRKDSSVLLKFVFANNKLTASFADDKRFKSKAWIEKVIVLGLQPGTYKAAAKSSLGDVTLDSWFEPNKAFVIRKPGMPIAEQWSIHIN